jgi:hypothetical protein
MEPIAKNSSLNYKKGDVVVFDAAGKHKHGHIQIYNGKNWVSDFKQKSFYVWKDVPANKVNFTIYRAK